MKNIFTKALLIASMTMMSVLPMAAQAIGTSCENPFIVTEEFKVNIAEPGSYWFYVTTYDLPLRVRYTPSVATGEKMTAYVDFSCTPGVYDDPNIYELTDLAGGWGFEMPLPFESKEVDGVHEIMMYESYRDIMTTFDILYNVEVKINVHFPQSGDVAVIPDTIFRNTVENSHWIELPDTLNVGLSTADSMYIMPLGDWTNDSVQIEWLGKDAPVSVWVSSKINFALDERDPDVVAHFTLDPSKGTTVKTLTKDYINSLLDGIGAGMFFAKIITVESAPIIFDYKPLSPEMARAIPMELNKAVEVKANDMDQYYYFRKDWSKNDLTFQAQGTDAIVAYFGTTPTFETATAQYTFNVDGKKSVLNISAKQLSIIANACATDHIFVRFATPTSTLITPVVWEVGDCVSNSVMEIFPDGVISVAANKKNDIYRIDYNKWSKGDTEVTWKGRLANKVYLADDCSFNLSASDEHVLFYQSVNANKSFVITKDFLDSVEDRVSEDGYLYFRFDTRIKGNLQTVFTLDTTAVVEPIEPDLPAVPTTECSLSSLPLAQGDQVTLNLDSAFTVYRIDYKAWLKSGATLAWNGAEALHTFVAETCTFALAPYNRYVLAYIPVPAQGNIVLDAIQLAAMEEYVSEDGFLYIRFLTKEEGVLEVK